MKPPRFQYCAPRILDEALYLLDTYAGDIKVLAGGQSFVPLLNMRLAGPAYILDINHILELLYIETEPDYLAVGALARQRQIERSILVQDRHPLLVKTIEHIGHMQIRNRGTVVGSVTHADPAAELPALLACLGGEVLVQNIRSERTIKAADFYSGYLSTTLEPNELVVEARFPWVPEQAGWSFMEFARRSGDYALVGAAAVLTPVPDDTCASAQLAFLGVSGAPVRAHDVESMLVGTNLDERTLDLAAEAARSVVSADMSDVHATVEYRRELAAQLTRRVLMNAWGRRERPEQQGYSTELNGGV
jgi:CO/xanthine dehydrogenase FAD-binding subunit